MKLLFALGQHAATISQLAAALGSNKGNIAHHLKVLRAAGLVRVAETRQVRGGTEQYYQRTARRLQSAGDERTSQTAVFFQAVSSHEIAAATEESVLVLRNALVKADMAVLRKIHAANYQAPQRGTQAGTNTCEKFDVLLAERPVAAVAIGLNPSPAPERITARDHGYVPDADSAHDFAPAR